MTTFSKDQVHLDRPRSSSSFRTSHHIPSTSTTTAARESSTVSPRTPLPRSSFRPDLPKHQYDPLPSIGIEDGDEQNQGETRLRRRQSLERTRSWAEEVGRNRKKSEKISKERQPLVADHLITPYGQPFWSVSSDVIDSLVEACGSSTSELSHLPSAAKVIAANKRRSYRIDTDSEGGKSEEEEEWWNEDVYRQRENGRSSNTLDVIQPRKSTRSERRRKTSDVDKGQRFKLMSMEYPSELPRRESSSSSSLPISPLNPATPPASVKQPATSIMSIEDIIKKHSPRVTIAENAVKTRAKKEIEEVRPTLECMVPMQKRPNQVVQSSKPCAGQTTAVEVSRRHGLTEKGSETSKVSVIPSLQPMRPTPNPTNSLLNMKPILRPSLLSQPSSDRGKGGVSYSPLERNRTSEKSLSREMEITTALLDQLGQLEQNASGSLRSSTPCSSRRISFQTSPAHTQRLQSCTTTFTPTKNAKLSKRKSLPESVILSAQAEATSLKHAVYLRSIHLNMIINLPKPYPETPLCVSLAEIGNPSGHPVVIFLGLGCVRYLIALFDDIARAFNLRLICIDRWGFGKTDQVSLEKRKVKDWSDVVERVLDQIGVKGFQVLAHSAGAPYALATALKMRDRIKGKVHLLSPWVNADIDGGYKWLKYVPNKVIKSATAAEWKLQSYLIGKPPPLNHKPISYDATLPVSNYSRPLATASSTDKQMAGTLKRNSMTKPDSSQKQRGLVRRASKILSRRPLDNFWDNETFAHADQSRSSLANPADDCAKSYEASSVSTTQAQKITSSVQQTRSHSQNSIISVDSSVQTDLKTPVSKSSCDETPPWSSFELGKMPTVVKEVGSGSFATELYELNASSLDTQCITTPAIHSTLLRTNSYPSCTSLPTGVTRALAPTGEAFTAALTQASHAECEPGTTADLLSIILNREPNPWGFNYTDYTGSVKIWYGSEDDKISEKSMRWMERSMEDVELIIRQGEGHNLLTSVRTMWEVFESLSKEAKSDATM
ncbi:uncharacterized protein IL334_004243 [Kwoniella shivajii]|uniref:AB hydrolase-1 domain-containing protein n=1 Tax=Kwoniella shivajii TaxID=564305 RepID=A0ABZ1D071_9TREE|nr:hypothetical protein IL334_004243 [Kwoniella shivajii]